MVPNTLILLSNKFLSAVIWTVFCLPIAGLVTAISVNVFSFCRFIAVWNGIVFSTNVVWMNFAALISPTSMYLRRSPQTSSDAGCPDDRQYSASPSSLYISGLRNCWKAAWMLANSESVLRICDGLVQTVHVCGHYQHGQWWLRGM